MTAAGGLKPELERSGIRALAARVMACLALLTRAPRLPPGAHFAWRSPARIVLGAAVVLVAVASAMLWLDAPAVPAMQALPRPIIEAFATITDFGKSGWFLVPIGISLIAMALFTPPVMRPISALVLAAVTVRLSFLFTAIALPSLFDSIVKRMIGRARPFVGGHADPFTYMPFVWRPEYASMPSGHATTAFAALVAIGLLWPRLRGIMAIYALAIGVSRVVVLAHHPSDVIAGAAFGAFGALLVRDWFAARRLGFALGADGTVRTLPGPSWARIKRVARRPNAP